MTTRRSPIRPRASDREFLGQHFDSGTKAPVSGYYAIGDTHRHFRKGRILPHVDNHVATYRFVQIGSEKAKLRVERPSLISRTAKKVNQFIVENQPLVNTAIDLVRGRSTEPPKH